MRRPWTGTIYTAKYPQYDYAVIFFLHLILLFILLYTKQMRCFCIITLQKKTTHILSNILVSGRHLRHHFSPIFTSSEFDASVSLFSFMMIMIMMNKQKSIIIIIFYFLFIIIIPITLQSNWLLHILYLNWKLARHSSACSVSPVRRPRCITSSQG